MNALLAQSKARNILFMIDACHSGGTAAIGPSQSAFPRHFKATADSAARRFATVPERFYDELAQAQGHVVIRACRADQSTPDLAYLGMGQSLLTLVLLEGLTGDADANHDGIVTLSELRIYTTKAIARISKRAAQFGEDQSDNHGALVPTFTSGAIGETGDLPLTVVTAPAP